MTDVDLEVADSFERIFPVLPVIADWDDVLRRVGDGRFGVKAAARLRHRRLVALAAAALFVALASASAFGTVRELLFGERPQVAFAAAPTWSPDGKRIAFVSVACAQWCNGPLEADVVNAEGSGRPELTRAWRVDNARLSYAGLPVWSPDWRKVALVRERGMNRGYPVHGRPSDIYVMNADGSGLRRLTRSPQNDGDPVWSPDGRRLAFVRIQGGRADIYVVHADGRGLRRLAHAIAFRPMSGGPSSGFGANPGGRRTAAGSRS